ncbi:hypothetical protein [Methylobacterium sp. ap11]|jgi:hypothetical protein|uniref:hypothetical protein n=1 Tax=Methylobacterium sp. ap11 TaxID=1761799 RepID=UPI000B8245FF|nr:hypothetical protein [Methylobacterium sp. ap11]
MTTSNHPVPEAEDVATILPAIVQALEKVADALDVIVDVACRAAILPEETADLLNDVGQTLIAQSRTIMHEAHERARGEAGCARRPPPGGTIDSTDEAS